MNSKYILQEIKFVKYFGLILIKVLIKCDYLCNTIYLETRFIKNEI